MINPFRSMTADAAVAYFHKAIAHLEDVVSHHLHMQELHDKVIDDAVRARQASSAEIDKAKKFMEKLKALVE